MGSIAGLLSGCGGDSGGAGGGDANANVLTQAPHCVAGGDSFHVTGTLDGVAIDDARTLNANVGLVNIGSPALDTPFSNLASLGSDQIELHLTWQGSLAYGQTGALTGDHLVAPATHPRSGEQLCIAGGEVGFVDGGNEDGVFKFHVTDVRAGADCSESVPADLRGCFN